MNDLTKIGKDLIEKYNGPLTVAYETPVKPRHPKQERLSICCSTKLIVRKGEYSKCSKCGMFQTG